MSKRNNKIGPNNYFRVVTNEEANRAEMYIYGYIGQDFWWGDDEMKEETITDLSFLKEFRRLEKDYDEIHIRINSPGGSVFHGDPIIAAIQASDATVHTWNDGMAASMGFDIWVAGDVRHMAENAKAMVHATISIVAGNAEEMRQTAEMLDKFDEAAIKILARAASMDEEDVKVRFYDGKDHWMIAKDIEALGLIEKAEDYEAEEVVNEPEKLNASELVRQFHEKPVLLTLDKDSKETIAAFTVAASGVRTNANTTGAKKDYEADDTDNEVRVKEMRLKKMQERIMAIGPVSKMG